jgi:hypothetical protein
VSEGNPMKRQAEPLTDDELRQVSAEVKA